MYQIVEMSSDDRGNTRSWLRMFFFIMTADSDSGIVHHQSGATGNID